jgi:uncharacterized protein YfdQ (DUF2303 family)
MDHPHLREALQHLETTAQQAVVVNVRYLEVIDGKGVKHDTPVAFVADGHGKVRAQSLLDFERAARAAIEERRLAMAPGPDRRRGSAKHETLASLIAHAERFKDEHTAVWASAEGQDASLTVVFNYHATGSDGTPRWGDHRGTYECPLSSAWTAWGAGQPLSLTQDALASFLEAHDYELAQGTLPSGDKSPPPAALLTMANTLETYSSATVKRERDPKTGRITLALSDDRGVANATPPPSFLILIPIFEDSEAEMLEVRLRVAVDKGGAATFTLQIHEAERKWRASYQKVISEVITKTGLPVYEGTPE